MEECLHQWFFLDGKLLSSCDFHDSIFDSTCAIYEVIRIVGGKPLFLEEHFNRFYESAMLANIRELPAKQPIYNAIRALIQSNNISYGNFKLFFGWQNGRQSPLIAAWLIPFSYPTEEMYSQGTKVKLLEYERYQPNAKIVRKDFKTMTELEMKQAGAYELLLHHKGKISEGSRSNVFFVLDGILHTAPDELVLKGITRKKVLEIVDEANLPIKMSAIELDQLALVQAAFLCGTSPKVLPISNIDDRYYIPSSHPYIEIISKMFDEKIKKDLESFSWE